MDRHTELRRLAQTLHTSEAGLSYLDSLSAHGLKAVRQRFQNTLLDEFEDLFKKLAGAGKLAPDAISALLCKKVFGPAITANLSYYTPIDKVASMCKHFDAEFMTEVSREQIPERAEPMLAGLPVELMKEVTRIMAIAGDFHIMGAMTDFLPEDKLMVLMEVVPTAEANLRVSMFAQRKDRISKLASKLPDAKLTEFIQAAFTSDDLIAELGMITEHMGKAEQQRMAKLCDSINKSYREKSKAIAEKAGLLGRLEAFYAA